MIKIIADSTCDLTDEILQRYDIDILPLYIHLGEKEYKDRLRFSRKIFFHGPMITIQHRKPLLLPSRMR